MISAIDIGGTKIAVGEVNENGKVMSRLEVPTEARRGHIGPHRECLSQRPLYCLFPFHCLWRDIHSCRLPGGAFHGKAGNVRSLSGFYVRIPELCPSPHLRGGGCVTLSDGAGMATLQVAINPLLRVAGGEEHFAFNSAFAQLVFGSASFFSPLLYSYLVLNLGQPAARGARFFAYSAGLRPEGFRGLRCIGYLQCPRF